MLEGFITPKEAALILHKTSDYIRKLCANGELPGAYKFGSAWLIPQSAVDNFKPKPRGFAAFWEKYRAEQSALQEELHTAIKNEGRGVLSHD